MKNTQKGFAPIILIVIVIAVLAVGGFFIVKSKIAVAPVQSPTPTATPTPTSSIKLSQTKSISPTPTPINMTNWKIYNYSKNTIEFSFKYPSDWQVTADNQGNVTVYKTAGDYKNYIYLSVENNPQKLLLDQWLKLTGLKISTSENLTINGLSAIKAVEADLILTARIFIASNDKVISFFTEQKSDYLGIFNAITLSVVVK